MDYAQMGTPMPGLLETDGQLILETCSGGIGYDVPTPAPEPLAADYIDPTAFSIDLVKWQGRSQGIGVWNCSYLFHAQSLAWGGLYAPAGASVKQLMAK
jgi:hypothetical protein